MSASPKPQQNLVESASRLFEELPRPARWLSGPAVAILWALVGTVTGPLQWLVPWGEAAILFAWFMMMTAHVIKKSRRGVGMTPIVLMSTGLVGGLVCLALIVGGFIWQGGLTKSAPDYSYTLSYQGVSLGYDPTSDNATLQIGLILMNVSPRPIRYKVASLRVVVGDRTLTTTNYTNEGGIIPSVTTRIYSYPSFAKSQIAEFMGKSGTTGTIEATVEYGPPDAPTVRQLA
jgi:hypothetical protein